MRLRPPEAAVWILRRTRILLLQPLDQEGYRFPEPPIAFPAPPLAQWFIARMHVYTRPGEARSPLSVVRPAEQYPPQAFYTVGLVSRPPCASARTDRAASSTEAHLANAHAGVPMQSVAAPDADLTQR